MYTLYIDTHSMKLVLALLKNKKLLKTVEINSNEHSKMVVDNIHELLSDASIEVDHLNEIIVITGPGSFTGVRIGVVIAKMIGYTKKINVKPISFLEAVSINYDYNVTIGIKDRNGAFLATFNEAHELISDYIYLNNSELLNYKEDILYDDCVDLEKLALYMQNKESINPHLLKPLYVKKIEVLK